MDCQIESASKEDWKKGCFLEPLNGLSNWVSKQRRLEERMFLDQLNGLSNWVSKQRRLEEGMFLDQTRCFDDHLACLVILVMPYHVITSYHVVMFYHVVIFYQ